MECGHPQLKMQWEKAIKKNEEFARKYTLYREYLPEDIKLILSHEYYDHTCRWVWNFVTALKKLDITEELYFKDGYGTQGTVLRSISEAGVAIISTAYDPLLRDYCKHKLGL